MFKDLTLAHHALLHSSSQPWSSPFWPEHTLANAVPLLPRSLSGLPAASPSQLPRPPQLGLDGICHLLNSSSKVDALCSLLPTPINSRHRTRYLAPAGTERAAHKCSLTPLGSLQDGKLVPTSLQCFCLSQPLLRDKGSREPLSLPTSMPPNDKHFLDPLKMPGP